SAAALQKPPLSRARASARVVASAVLSGPCCAEDSARYNQAAVHCATTMRLPAAGPEQPLDRLLFRIPIIDFELSPNPDADTVLWPREIGAQTIVARLAQSQPDLKTSADAPLLDAVRKPLRVELESGKPLREQFDSVAQDHRDVQ